MRGPGSSAGNGHHNAGACRHSTFDPLVPGTKFFDDLISTSLTHRRIFSGTILGGIDDLSSGIAMWYVSQWILSGPILNLRNKSHGEQVLACVIYAAFHVEGAVLTSMHTTQIAWNNSASLYDPRNFVADGGCCLKLNLRNQKCHEQLHDNRDEVGRACFKSAFSNRLP